MFLFSSRGAWPGWAWLGLAGPGRPWKKMITLGLGWAWPGRAKAGHEDNEYARPMGKAAIYQMPRHGDEGAPEAADKSGDASERGASPQPGTPATSDEDALSRWAFVDQGGDASAIPVAKEILKVFEGWPPLEMTVRVLSELRDRPMPRFVVRPYYDEWAGWGIGPEILALALARASQKEGVKDPLRLVHYIVSHYARKTGLVT